MQRLHLQPYQVYQVVDAIVELLADNGLRSDALSPQKWAKLGACLQAGMHDEFYFNDGGSATLRRVDVVSGFTPSGNLLVAYDGSDNPSSTLTKDLRERIARHTRNELCAEPKQAERPMGSCEVRKLDNKPSRVRPGHSMLPGKWYAISTDRVIHMADQADGWIMPLSVRMSLFSTTTTETDRDSGLPCLIGSTLDERDRLRYAELIDAVENATSSQNAAGHAGYASVFQHNL